MMTLKEEMKMYPERVQRKISLYTENYCALIIAASEDVTTEEAFLSLDRKKIYKFIRHNKYSTYDISRMIALRQEKRTLTQIALAYGLTPKMVRQIINIYGGDRFSMSKCKSCGASIEWVITTNNKKIPVNKKEYNVVQDSKGDMNGITFDGKVIRCSLAMEGSEGACKVRVTHFSTCPDADKYRRAR
jgi:hypothetical protein